MDKLDKIIELLETIKANQEARQYYYPPIQYYPIYPQPIITPDPMPSYPQPNWTYPETTCGNMYEC